MNLSAARHASREQRRSAAKRTYGCSLQVGGHGAPSTMCAAMHPTRRQKQIGPAFLDPSMAAGPCRGAAHHSCRHVRATLPSGCHKYIFYIWPHNYLYSQSSSFFLVDFHQLENSSPRVTWGEPPSGDERRCGAPKDRSPGERLIMAQAAKRRAAKTQGSEG